MGTEDYLAACAICGFVMYSSEAHATIMFQDGQGGEVKDFCSTECYEEYKNQGGGNSWVSLWDGTISASAFTVKLPCTRRMNRSDPIRLIRIVTAVRRRFVISAERNVRKNF